MADIWFNGPVANAVATVNENNLVFLVFIYGSHYSLVYFSTCIYLSLLQMNPRKVKDSKTPYLKKQYVKTHENVTPSYSINSIQVVSVLRQKTVALKMEKDSEDAKMFSQLCKNSQANLQEVQPANLKKQIPFLKFLQYILFCKYQTSSPHKK